MDFEFYVGGIEDAILDLLETEMKPLGVRQFMTYSGELDSAQLQMALKTLTTKFPLIMVAYSSGDDVRMPKTSPALGMPLHFRHDCQFLVVCVCADARGDRAQRRGANIKTQRIGCYQMLSKVRELLTGLQISTMVDDEKVLLTHQPLIPLGNEYIARVPSMTAYAIPIETSFNWSSIDRSQSGSAVTEIVLGVNSLNAPSNQNNNLPGVKFLT